MNSKFRLEIKVSDNFSKELKKLNRKIRRLKWKLKILRIYNIILNFFNGKAVKLREVCLHNYSSSRSVKDGVTYKQCYKCKAWTRE